MAFTFIACIKRRRNMTINSNNAPVKVCVRCETQFLATRQFWKTQTDGVYGLRDTCRTCEQETPVIDQTRTQRIEFMCNYWLTKRANKALLLPPANERPRQKGRAERQLIKRLTAAGLTPIRCYWELTFFCVEFAPDTHAIRQTMNSILIEQSQATDHELSPFDRYYDRLPPTELHPHGCYKARFFVSRKHQH
jgi:hypothetical protein